MIDSIYILSLEHDKPRRQRLLNLLDEESDESLIEKTKVVKGIYHPQINEDFLRSNKLDYFKGWQLKDEEAKSILSGYDADDGISYENSCFKFYTSELRKGQIASLIGHIECWKQMIVNNDDYALIFEDDAWWPNDQCLTSLIEEVFSLNVQFDICYIGRAPLIASQETPLDCNPKYCIPKYSYNNQSYIFSRQGALKVLAQDPHKNLMSSDEFLPACYDDHPRQDIAKVFKKCLKPIALCADREFAWQMNTKEISREQGITWSNKDNSHAI
mgnify:FL=1